MSHLLDANVWLALAFESHRHHAAARRWFERSTDEQCLFCRVTQQGFLRIATNRRAFGYEALSPRAAWSVYDRLIGDPRVLYSDEPRGLESLWRTHTGSENQSPSGWTDAYLFSFAAAGGFALVTFDQGMRRYAGADLVLLA
ncbi:TA system VapC family ribonuclease toxin [Botrimarina sp.]|uniref:TA system VapC family ribonuclease toxin n=1 Tax=Botrimarina sp. TaxID=2795802 RepID=UPI0032EAB5CD